jgi:3-oxoacyl-[acyl-carrier protein] reductase
MIRRIAFIGGGSKGLGFASASELAKAGHHVIICGRDQDTLDVAVQRLRYFDPEALGISGDMGNPQDNQRLINTIEDKYGRLDILINNSGGPLPGKYNTLTEDDWFKAFQHVLMYNIRMTTLAVPLMKKNKWGRIINITSLAVKEPADGLILSTVFRTGVVAFAKSISKDLIKDGITINNLCPGAFKTERAVQLIKSAAQSSGKSEDEIMLDQQSRLPLGRYQEPEELGALSSFLCSESASGITGTTITIDGGISNSLM